MENGHEGGDMLERETRVLRGRSSDLFFLRLKRLRDTIVRGKKMEGLYLIVWGKHGWRSGGNFLFTGDYLKAEST